MPLHKGSSREVSLAYIAGLIDGEGSISASPSGHCKTNYRISIAIAMCDREPLDFAASVLGGQVRRLKRTTQSGKPVFSWTLYCQNAANALEELRPYLMLKGNRARNAIDLARSMLDRHIAKKTVLSEDQITNRKRLANAIKNENIAGNARCARYGDAA